MRSDRAPVVIDFEHRARAQAKLLDDLLSRCSDSQWDFGHPKRQPTIDPLPLLQLAGAAYATPRLTAKRLFATKAFHDLY